ncbi:ankyrin repeat protein, putative [Trichomonas vaginalis G3]|uniref:Ankyrin repeat protein, putative n=1 Tax=Trichomonas vaginalis (strain ATCC PRA-98 / G3) TaxID=412133 RepID=A2DH36_TRIV3|nr:hypothetical protein TVAGG3_0341350 [Trichomonas vaginalis G3]EAY20346.1 ankyrin repeat protein, putative [Trichomonas vaginalis G3]KAI5530663.1 hypothetical protein TVAGG3_0341350 [Trichomonas vaginalis G3]|eukprot:XP_001581332.1 ankyrin repeat protein [Trichomonas vaginalis G3]
MVQFLIEHGAYINKRFSDYHGGYDYKDFETPLAVAIKHGSLEIVKKLVESGADVNMKIIDTDEDYCTERISPLEIANENDAIEIANYLVEKGAIAYKEFVDDDDDETDFYDEL